jgi:V/A-type H+/Na+-transporting ATPase subunit E
MTLEALLQEVQARSAAENRALQAKLEAERKAIEDQTRAETERIRAEADRKSQTEAAREKARLLASAKLEAKKVLFEARERRTSAALEEVKKRLAAYAKSSEYPQLLTSMVTTGTSVLGDKVKLLVRPEDVPLLPSKMRGWVDDKRPLTALGGLVVERADGSRSLNYTFEELLRLREDRVREILSR